MCKEWSNSQQWLALFRDSRPENPQETAEVRIISDLGEPFVTAGFTTADIAGGLR